MFHVGLDIHSKHISLCVLNDTGQVVHRSKVRTIDQMMQVLENLTDRFEVCYEASCGYGHFHDLLRPLAVRVLVAQPGQLRLIFRSKNKNDRNDAERLAKLLYLGEAPTVHVPSLDVRTWRELITCRSQVIAKRTRAKNTIRALLRSAGQTAPRQPGLWTKAGAAWLRRLALPTVSQQLRRDLLLEEIETLTQQLRRIEQELNHRAEQSPPVLTLRSIPGVSVRTAEAVAAFVDDPHRFGRAKAVGNYFGLVPCQDQSGDKNRLGHITREGPAVVRRLLAEAAWQARRRSPTVAAYFDRAQHGDPQRKKISLVATCHYLVRVMWAMLKRGTIWDENWAQPKPTPTRTRQAQRSARSHAPLKIFSLFVAALRRRPAAPLDFRCQASRCRRLQKLRGRFRCGSTSATWVGSVRQHATFDSRQLASLTPRPLSSARVCNRPPSSITAATPGPPARRSVANGSG